MTPSSMSGAIPWLRTKLVLLTLETSIGYKMRAFSSRAIQMIPGPAIFMKIPLAFERRAHAGAILSYAFLMDLR
jgi:hypothetical protein